jgi:hypothetical protein
MESTVNFYSFNGFVIFLIGLVMAVCSLIVYLLVTVFAPERVSWCVPPLIGFVLGAVVSYIGNIQADAPMTNVVHLAPREELVGSHVEIDYSACKATARVIVRCPDGRLSVRDVNLPQGTELEIRSTSIEQ